MICVSAGVVHAEEVIAWTSVPLRDPARPASHTMRSLPLFHLPIVLESAVRFPLLGDAMLKCYFHETACRPGATSSRVTVSAPNIGPLQHWTRTYESSATTPMNNPSWPNKHVQAA